MLVHSYKTVTLQDGSLLAIGGAHIDAPPVGGSQRLDPVTLIWSNTTSRPYDRTFNDAVILNDGTGIGPCLGGAPTMRKLARQHDMMIVLPLQGCALSSPTDICYLAFPQSLGGTALVREASVVGL